MKKLHQVGSAVLAVSSMVFGCSPSAKTDKKNSLHPNIILIMADDMGFSDLGCYGGEIQTPNLDALAKTGVRYSQFYNAARCCPTRASLLTGVYPHQAGMGWMTNADLGTPAYQGDLSKNVATIAEVVETAGYETYMTGKWHLSNTRKDKGMVMDNWPVQRGFDRYFGLVGGAGNYFKLPVFSNNTRYMSPENFYLTNAISDSSAMFIQDHFNHHPNSPMFMYVAYTSPHWPLHALEEDIEKYRDVYDVGWDSIRKRRLEKQQEIGLWEDVPELSPRDERVPSWDALSEEQKKDFARRMAIYAAQVDAMDQGIGRIVNKLKELGQLDNTIIFFLADNGGCAEFISSGKSKNLTGNLADTYESYRIHWANASNTPFREYKHWVHEGGVRTPLIVHWPKGIDKDLNNCFIRDYGHLTDIMATCVELSGAQYPDSLNGETIVPMQGTSLVPHFSGIMNGKGPIFWEHEANIGMRDGDWKLVAKTPEAEPFDSGTLELYNIQKDPTELNNLANQYPEKLDSMYRAWKKWADFAEVFPMDTREYGERSNTYKRQINGEFDLNFGDWDIRNPYDIAEFQIDRSSKLSGANSAEIRIVKISEKPDDAALMWVFPTGEAKQYKVSFRAVANRNTKLNVTFEEAGKNSDVLATNVFQLSTEVKVFSLNTKMIVKPTRYKLSFGVGNNPVDDKIWLDAVTLSPIDPEN
ncbi:arylsulfatase [Gaoshiqia sediminis]|uniref:Arylsulfatase n=1 Tax=Gaoshiqia sediminis TaxID=2986998 RepID=A0AA42CAZ7_9BACT|nr:arylsulfatase [Gaoshiqia sediminis]MCW0484250.1 arylsulfatase [Gaoshiqia sediminis]